MTSDLVRLDKWLWAARIVKTRALAVDWIARGRVGVNGEPAKPSRHLQPGDLLQLRQGSESRVLKVRALSLVRGPAAVAQALYEETAESIAARLVAAERRRIAADPAAAIEQGRPTKRDRRQIERVQADWRRWSASADDLPGSKPD
jgi:ribosome-associated heat shock protein Hsp15